MRSEPVEVYDYKDHKIKVYQDSSSINPREDWDPAFHMTCWHRRYNLGDDHNYRDNEDFILSLLEMDIEYDTNHDFKELYNKLHEKYFINVLYLYDHSGITISMGSFGDRWDSGPVGFIWLSKDDALKEWAMNDDESDEDYEKRILLYMEEEVEVYDQCLRGEVYGYMVEGDYCSDSCWGYFGDYDPDLEDGSDLYNEAVSNIDACISLEERNKKECYDICAF